MMNRKKGSDKAPRKETPAAFLIKMSPEMLKLLDKESDKLLMTRSALIRECVIDRFPYMAGTNLEERAKKGIDKEESKKVRITRAVKQQARQLKGNLK